MDKTVLRAVARPNERLNTFIVFGLIILALPTLSGCNQHALAALSGTLKGVAKSAETRDCVNEGGDPAACRTAVSQRSTRAESSTTFRDNGSFRLMTQKRLGGGVTRCNYGVRTVTVDNYGSCPEYIK